MRKFISFVKDVFLTIFTLTCSIVLCVMVFVLMISTRLIKGLLGFIKRMALSIGLDDEGKKDWNSLVAKLTYQIMRYHIELWDCKFEIKEEES